MCVCVQMQTYTQAIKQVVSWLLVLHEELEVFEDLEKWGD